MKFVSTANDGAVAAEDRMKIGKEYKVGVIVSVNVSALRKDLEAAGIIKSLGAGFN
jgi:GTP-sensing pleiotropic transcriptional regulator CodY